MKQTEKRRNFGIRTVRMLLIAAVLVCALATTAFAATNGFGQYENFGQMLEGLFGQAGGKEALEDFQPTQPITPVFEREPLDTQAAEEYVAPNISGINETVTFDWYVLTVESALYDEETGCGVVYYWLENTKGPFKDYILQESGEISSLPCRQNVYGRVYLIPEQSTEDKFYLGFYYSVDTLAQEDHVRIGFYNRSGDWDTYIDIPVEDAGLQHLTLADGAIVLSPISLRVDWDKLGVTFAEWDTMPDYKAIHYADGSEYVVQDEDTIRFAHGVYRDGVQEISLTRIVQLDQVTEIVLGNTVYAVG